jgi:hypothetical protein
MKKLVSILLFTMLCGVASAQTTNVTATVTDSDGVNWINAPFTATFVGSGPGQPSINGQIFTQSYSGFTNSSGVLTINGMGDVGFIVPPNSSWKFTITPAVTGGHAYTVNVPVTGATMNISSQIASAIVAPRLSGGPSIQAYADVEVSAVPGNTYFRLTDSTQRCYGTSWTTCGGGTGGGGTVTLENVFSSPASFTFAHNLNSLFPMVNCYTRVGAGYGSATYSASPVDANDTAVAVPSAGDYICSFSATAAVTPDFSIASSPTTLLYEPTMSGTQHPTFTINQTGQAGYSGTANYTVSGLASGMTGAYSPTSITGTGSSTLTLSFPYNQTPATTSFTVQGSDGTHTHTASPSITVGNINQGLVECWPMNDGSGTTMADGCGTGNTETLALGTLTWGSNPPLPGTTATFSATAGLNGTNTTATNFDGTTPFSISTWVYMNGSNGESRTLVSNLAASTFQGYELGIQNLGGTTNAAYMYLINNFGSGNYQVNWTLAGLALGTWYNITVTYDGSRTIAGELIYINGSQASTFGGDGHNLSASIANGTTPVALGVRPNGNTNPLDGIEGYTRMWNRVLSATDVANYYAAGAR